MIGTYTSSTRIGGLLNKMTVGAGIVSKSFMLTYAESTERTNKFTTHCFRRGGAQHRFMFLLDEYSHYESVFTDMLSPTRNNNRHITFIGSSPSLDSELVTKQVLATSQENLRKSINDDIGAQLVCIQQTLQSILDVQALQVVSPSVPCAILPPERNLSKVQNHHLKAGKESTSVSRVAPHIPNAKDWKEVVQQWFIGDPVHGLDIPLSEWSCAMRGTNRSRYSHRSLIANEYKRVIAICLRSMVLI